MESPSSSLHSYDVFLSFRGEDTRSKFISHLYKELDQKGIRTFKDDKELKKGKSISPELLKAIEESTFAIIVLSENYASSSWCLDELVKIIECKNIFQLTVIPIFYNVSPSDTLFFFSFPVSLSSSYLLQYASEQNKDKVVLILCLLVLCFFFFFLLFVNRDRRNIKGNVEKVHKWRKALEDAASISGYEILDAPNTNEADSVQWVVDEILDQLVYNKTKPEEKLVNIDALIRDVNSLFFKEEDVRVVGIWGMGGSGKTTIARAFFDRYSNQFKHKVFLANIREVTQKDGAEHLQSNLISEILKSKSIHVKDVCEGANMIKDRLCKKKVLLILDDVDNKYELDALAGSTSWFGKGSKVIITTRNRKLLTKPEVDETYVVNLLPDGEALQLFSLHAFNQAIPAEGFEELSQEVIDYAKGLPLALKV
ncbi:disease resistance protein Roq1-like [Lycium ferocissimum]|uniref:disease resistance protein Roq1-like n=1 Tax=Lycium ferocissimum TaxID=112874 RepID=UPI002814CBE4|nr:disease resistance protein Roq1-like [Lycium ferocissimum]